MVDYNLLSVFQPMIIIGALTGTYINKVAPPLVTSVLLVILLVRTTYSTIKKGVAQYKQENETSELKSCFAGELESLNPDIKMGNSSSSSSNINKNNNGTKPAFDLELMDISGTSTSSSDAKTNAKSIRTRTPSGNDLGLENFPPSPPPAHAQSTSPPTIPIPSTSFPFCVDRYLTMADKRSDTPVIFTATRKSEKMRQVLLSEYMRFPKFILGKILVMFTFVLIITVTRRLFLICGSSSWWIFGFLNLPICLFVALNSRQHLLEDGRTKKEVHYEYLSGDIKWDQHR